MVDLLDLDPLKRLGSMEQRLASLEEQVGPRSRPPFRRCHCWAALLCGGTE